MEITYLNSENKPLQELTQWDINRKIKIKGLELKTAPVIHFYNDYQSRALVVNSVLENEDIIVNIPNILLQNDVPITLAIFVTIPNEKIEGKTIYMEKLPVRTKLKPNDYEYEENIDYINWLELSEEAKKQLAEMQAIINDVQNKLDNGEFIGNGIDRIEKTNTTGLVDTYTIYYTNGTTYEYTIVNGTNGEKGDKGDTPIRGKDYWTEQDKTEVVNETKDLVIPLIETNCGNKIELSIDTLTYIMTIKLLNKANTVLSTATIDLPLETMVVNARYDNATKELIIVLNNGTELKVPIGDIINGLVSEITFNNAVKDLQNQITANNDELNNLVGEVSDVKQEVGNIKTEQTLQNKAIQKNVDDIIATNKSLEEKYSKVKSNLINLEAGPAEEIQVNDSSDLEAKIDVRGNTKQETTKGYQLFELLNRKEYLSVINPEDIVNFSEKYLFSGYANSGINYPDHMQGKYTIEKNKLTFTQKEYYFGFGFNQEIENYSKNIYISYKADKKTILGISFYDETGKRISSKYIETQFGGKINPIPSNAKNFIFNFVCNESAETQTPVIITDIQVEYGEKATPYEPYTGGQASPNPEYPQEIESVKGNVEIKQEQNLINIKSDWTPNLWGYDIIQEDNTLSYTSFRIQVKPNTTYTFSFKWLDSNLIKNIRSVIVYTKEKPVVNVPYIGNEVAKLNNNGNNNYSFTFTTPAKTMWVFIFAGWGAKNTPLEKMMSNIRLAEEKLYPLKLGDIELNGTPDLRDKPIKENRKWYWLLNYRKTVFTGDEIEWTRNPNSTEINNIYWIEKGFQKYFPNIVEYISPYMGNYVKNNYFKYGDIPTMNIYRINNKNGVQWILFNTKFKTLEEWKQWLKDKYNAGNPVYIIYQLATPEKIEITDPTLISQLEALANIKTFKPVTNLSSNSIANLKLDYIADTKAYIDNLINPQIAEVRRAIVEGGV